MGVSLFLSLSIFIQKHIQTQVYVTLLVCIGYCVLWEGVGRCVLNLQIRQ